MSQTTEPRTSESRTSESRKTISYQGEPGANSHIICAQAYPDWTPAALRLVRRSLRGGE